MDKSTIAEVKSMIRSQYESKINKLKEEMQSALSALSIVEESFSPKEGSTIPATQGEPILRRRVLAGRNRSARERIVSALGNIHGEFTTSMLSEMVTKDEIGRPIKKGTFAPVFADLVKDGTVVVLKKPKGNHAGVYIRAEENSTTPPSHLPRL